MPQKKIAQFLPRTKEQKQEYPMWDVKVLKDTPCKHCGKVIPKGALAYGDTTTVFHNMQGCPEESACQIQVQVRSKCQLCGGPIQKGALALWCRSKKGSYITHRECLKRG